MKHLIHLCLVLTALMLQAQSQSRLTGTVTDNTGALIVGAKLTLRNTASGVSYRTATNSSGIYVYAALIPGTYELSGELEGFKRFHRTGIVLETGYTRTADVAMELGAVSDSIEVKAQTPLLEDTNSTVGQLIERATVSNMPLESRRSASLVRLMGAVVFASEDSGAEQIPRFSMAGGRGLSQMWFLDGGVAQNQSMGNQQLALNPPAESLQEFKAEVNNYSAEYGRTGGGLIVMTTRSGTNKFHGAGYEFLRNDKLDSRTFFAASKPALRYNVFGTSFGGPIRKDKTFFFFNYEGSRRRTPQVFSNVIVPHPAEVTGDFSARRDLTVLDPLTRQPFPGNIIPANRLDPVGLAYARLYPAPNVASDDPTVAPRNNYYASGSDKLSQNFYTARVDHTFGQNDRVFGRFMDVRAPEQTIGPFQDKVIDPRALQSQNRHINWITNYFHNFTPSLMNEARFNWGDRLGSPSTYGVGSGRNRELGVKGVDQDYFATMGATGLTQLGGNTQLRIQSPILTQYIADTLSWFKGKHQFKTGFEYRYTHLGVLSRALSGGRFDFNDRATGSGLASLLLGWTSTASFSERQKVDNRMDYYGGFVQDDWKVTSRLTVNLGVRWELNTPPWEANNNAGWFDGTVTNPVSGNLGALTRAGENGGSRYPHHFDKNNFGPRIGLAYRLGSGMVIRSGYGLAYSSPYWAGATAPGFGFDRQADFSSVDGGFTPAFLFRNGMPPIPEPNPSPGYGAVVTGAAPQLSPQFFAKNHQTGYSQQWNLTIQKQLRGNFLTEIAYLANIGRKLPGTNVSINMVPLVDGHGPTQQSQRLRPYPQYGNITWLSPVWGNSSYHAVNAKIEKRFSTGLSFLTNYTYSKFIDDSHGLTDQGPFLAYTHLERRKSDKSIAGNDIRHRYIASAVYDLPFGTGRRWAIGNSLLRGMFGGWGISLITELRSGFPWGAIEQTDRTNTFATGNRPNQLRSWEIQGDRSRGERLAQYFDTGAFAAPAVGEFGNAARFVGTGLATISIDSSFNKRWKIGESLGFSLRGDFYNLPNRPNFAAPNTVRGRGDFGRITSTLPGSTGRLIQLSGRLEF